MLKLAFEAVCINFDSLSYKRWDTTHGVNNMLNFQLKIGEWAMANGLVDFNKRLGSPSPITNTTPPPALTQSPSPQVSLAPPTPIRLPQSQLVTQIDDDEDDEDKPFINLNYDPNAPMWRKTG